MKHKNVFTLFAAFVAPFIFIFILTTGIHAHGGLSQTGIISDRPIDLIGDWIVDGVTFTADANTIFNYEHGPLEVGDCAEVEYEVIGGDNIASKIKSEDSAACGGGGHDEHMQVYGRLDSFPANFIGDWIVDGVTYTADSTTTFEQHHGNFAANACVEVKYTPNTNAALKIETEHDYKCNGSSGTYSEIYGIVETFPTDLLGNWIVDGITYTASSATQFELEHGEFFVGGCVEVKYTASTNAAHEISSASADDCNGSVTPPRAKFYGLIETIPQNNIGTWTIGSTDFESSDTTTLVQEHGNFAPGICAEVSYYDDNGVHQAVKIKTQHAYHCNGGSYANTAYGTIESYPADLYGSWVIDDLIYAASVGVTTFEQHHGNFGVGVCVKVHYFAQDGVNQAVKIETESNDHCNGGGILPGYSKVYATIDNFPPTPYVGNWGIGGAVYTATAVTQFEQEHGNFAVGTCVQARYAADEANLLYHVETEHAYKCESGGGSNQFTGYGTIEIMPSTQGFTGTWQIGGIVYEADANTLFEQEYGFFTPGAYVQVKYVISGTLNLAAKIETHVAPGAGTENITGTLTVHDSSDDWNDWVVNGITYKADSAIQAEQSLQLGQSVFLNTYQTNGVHYVTTVTSAAHEVFLPMIADN